MERINMTKYGFIRSKEDDFSDDGCRFTCYKVGKTIVSKFVYAGLAYISARRNDYLLMYDEYSKLPHYAALDRLNGGINVAEITEDDLKQLYSDCVEYDREYDEALAKIDIPTKEEFVKYLTDTREANKEALNKVNALIAANPSKIFHQTNYQLHNYQDKYIILEKAANKLDNWIEEEAEQLTNNAPSSYWRTKLSQPVMADSGSIWLINFFNE